MNLETITLNSFWANRILFLFPYYFSTALHYLSMCNKIVIKNLLSLLFTIEMILLLFYWILIAGKCSLIACLRHNYFVYILLNGKLEWLFFSCCPLKTDSIDMVSLKVIHVLSWFSINNYVIGLRFFFFFFGRWRWPFVLSQEKTIVFECSAPGRNVNNPSLSGAL